MTLLHNCRSSWGLHPFNILLYSWTVNCHFSTRSNRNKWPAAEQFIWLNQSISLRIVTVKVIQGISRSDFYIKKQCLCDSVNEVALAQEAPGLVNIMVLPLPPPWKYKVCIRKIKQNIEAVKEKKCFFQIYKKLLLVILCENEINYPNKQQTQQTPTICLPLTNNQKCCPSLNKVMCLLSLAPLGLKDLSPAERSTDSLLPVGAQSPTETFKTQFILFILDSSYTAG